MSLLFNISHISSVSPIQYLSIKLSAFCVSLICMQGFYYLHKRTKPNLLVVHRITFMVAFASKFWEGGEEVQMVFCQSVSAV